MIGMNFTGQHRRTRQINLGGRNNAGTASKDAVVRRAQHDRERRERARREDAAATLIQAFYRARTAVARSRRDFATAWDATYLHSDNSMLRPPAQVAACVRQFVYFFPYTFAAGTSNGAQVAALREIVEANLQSIRAREIEPQLVARLLGALSAVLQDGSWAGAAAPGMPGTSAAAATTATNIFYILELLQTFSNVALLSTCSAYIQSVTAKHVALPGASPESFYAANPQTAIVRDSLINVIAHQLESSPGHTADFFASFLATPGLHVFFPPSQFLAHALRLAVSDTPQQTLSQTQLVWRLANFLHFFGAVAADSPAFYSTLDAFLAPISIHVDPPTPLPTSKKRNRLPQDAERAQLSNAFIIAKLDELMSRGFFTALSHALLPDQSASPPELTEHGLSQLSSIVSAIMALYPVKKQQLVLFVTLSPLALLQRLWVSIKRTPLFALVAAGAPQKTDLAEVLSAAPQREQGHRTLSQLTLFLELCSYWLIVANDAEFHGSARAAHGLPRTETAVLAQFLRNLCFALLWHAAEIAADKPLDALLNGHQGLSFANSSVLVMRQIYIRDSRRQFLPEGFWIMISGFQIEHFISAVVQEEEQVRRLSEAEREQVEEGADDSDSDSDVETETYRQAKISDANPRSLGGIVPRLEILRQAPFFIPFDTRLKIFHEFIAHLQAEEAMTNPPTLNMFGLEMRQTGLIRRDHQLEDAYAAFNKLGSDFRQPIAVRFSNEHGGVEAGIGAGITKEFLTVVTKTAFRPSADNEYHVDTKEGLFSAGREQLVFPNPVLGVSRRHSRLTAEERQDANRYMVFLGKIIAKCLYENILVDVEFAPFFLQKWAAAGMGYRNSFDDLYLFDPELYENLIKLSSYSGDVERDLMLDFTISQEAGHGAQETIELKPGGASIPVTNANRLEYIHAVANYKLNTVLHQQTALFLQGLALLLPPRWLAMFNAREIQMLISGRAAALDVADLRANTVLIEYSEEDSTVRDFWAVVAELGEEDQAALIRFVTSVPKAPLLGFGALTPHFAIRNAGSDQQRLPTSSTCINLIKLPAYGSRALLREKLLAAIHADAGFELS